MDSVAWASAALSAGPPNVTSTSTIGKLTDVESPWSAQKIAGMSGNRNALS
jgi:hypothetical protein